MKTFRGGGGGRGGGGRGAEGLNDYVATLRKRRKLILGSFCRRGPKNQIGKYPITECPLRDLSKRKLVLFSTFFLEGPSSRADVTSSSAWDFKGIPHFHFSDMNTNRFVRDHIDGHVKRYESSSPYVFQAIFDSFEWRTLVFYLVTLHVPGSETVLRVRENEFVVEKRTAFKSGLRVDLGTHFKNLMETFNMTQRKKPDDLVSVSKCRLNVSQDDDEEFVIEISSVLPEIENVEETHKRYTEYLSRILDPKVVTSDR